MQSLEVAESNVETTKLDTVDMIAIDNSEPIKIEKENVTITHSDKIQSINQLTFEKSKQNSLQLFDSLYNTSIYLNIEDDSVILDYCKDKPSLYESLNKVNKHFIKQNNSNKI